MFVGSFVDDDSLGGVGSGLPVGHVMGIPIAQ